MVVHLRAQHDFWPDDLTFEGSTRDGRVHALFLGDRLVFSSHDGIPLKVFDVSSALRHVLHGHQIRGGLDIAVQARIEPPPDLVEPGSLTVTITGEKPVHLY